MLAYIHACIYVGACRYMRKRAEVWRHLETGLLPITVTGPGSKAC